MKHVVTENYLDEAQVHPPEVSEQFSLAINDSLAKLTEEKSSFVEIASPYAVSEPQAGFSKVGFNYSLCSKTGSLYLNKRPSSEQVSWYFNKSPRAKYLQSKPYIAATQALRAHQTQIHSSWVNRLLKFNQDVPKSVVEVESETPDLLISLRALGFDLAYSLNPRHSENSLDRHGIRTIVSSNLSPNILGNIGLVAAFRTFEQQHDPRTFTKEIFSILSSGGYFLLTTRVASGFDIQMLWEHAKISPLEHMNLPTVEGIKSLIEQSGFVIQELSTPGQLDVQLLEKAIKEDPTISLPRWTEYFMTNRDEYSKIKLQTFLQENLLSSNLRLVAQKR